MLRRKQSKAYRFVAAFLALLMLASLIPVSHAGLVQAADILESYTVTLTDGSQDGEGNYIPLTQEGAEVTLTDPALQEAEPLSASTDANGVATFANCVENGKTYQLSVTGVNGYEDLVSTNVTPALNDINYYAVLIPAQPQPVTTTISGTVNGSDGQGYSGAQVSLFEGTIEESEAALFTTDTDASGGYTFPNVDISKSYTIRVEPKEEDPQYKTGEISITGLTAEPYTASTLTLEKEQFSIAVDATENGSVTVNGSGAPFLVDYGENAEIKVEAATGYRIGTLKVDDEIVVAEAAGQQNYNYTISAVTKGHKVSVTFLRQTYTITFTVGENGKVEYANGIEAVDGGSVSFDESTDPEKPTTVTVTATPDNNYRVKEVKIDGISVNNLTVANNGDYKTVLEMTKDYTFSVTFELNKYEISVAEGVENGTVAVDSADSKVEHGSPVTLTLTPNPDYTIQSVVINQQSYLVTALPEGVTLELKQGDTYALELTVANVSEKMEIGAVFESIPSISWADAKMSISETEGMIKEDTAEGSNWIYPYNSTVTISTGLTGIVVGDYSAPVQSTWTTAESIPLNSQTIQVLDGVVLKQVTMESPIQIIIDKEAPAVSVAQQEYPWTNREVTVSGTATEAGEPASGLAKVVYSTTVLSNEAVLEETENVADLGEDGSYTFTVSGDQNAAYYIYAVDRSGNVSDAATTTVQIDTESPTVDSITINSQNNSVTNEGILFRSFGIFSSQTIYVTVTVSDNASGVASVVLYKDGAELRSSAVEDGKAFFELGEDDFAQAASISFEVTDNAGMSATAAPSDFEYSSNAVQISSDAKKPSVEIIPEEGAVQVDEDSWYGDDMQFTVRIRDENVGIQNVQILLNEKDITESVVSRDFQAEKVTSDEYTIDTAEFDQATDGKYELSVEVINNASVANGETPATDTVYVDKTNPSIDDITVENHARSTWEEVLNFLSFGMFFKDEVDVTVTVSDPAPSAGFGAATLTATVDGEEFASIDDAPEAVVNEDGEATGQYAYTFTLPAPEEGTAEVFYENVTIVVNDLVNHNVSTSVGMEGAANNIMIEAENPVINTSLPGADATVETENETQAWYRDDIEIGVSIMDENSGLHHVRILDENNSDPDNVLVNETLSKQQTTETKQTSWKTTINTSQATWNDQDGSYRLVVIATDNAGNETSAPIVVYKDESAPAFETVTINPVEQSAGKKIINFLTFGNFCKEQVQITITATDAAPSAGLATATLYRQNNSGEWEQLGDPASVMDERTFVFKVPVDEVGSEEKVYFNEALAVKVEDAVGHSNGPTSLSAISNEDNIDSDQVMIETQKPIISDITTSSQGETCEAVNGQKWFDEQTITFSFTVSDLADGTLEEDASGLQRVRVYDANNGYDPENPDAAVVLDKEFTNPEKEVEWSTSEITSENVVRGNDGSYHLVIVATDNAGNQNEPVDFIVYQDLNDPQITNFAFSHEQYVEGSEEPVVEQTEYGYYFRENTDVTVTAADDGPSAGLRTVSFYTVDVEGTRTEYVGQPADQAVFTIPANFKGQIYAKATDNVDNTPVEGGADGKGYVTPDGVILETQDKHNQENHITFTKEDTPYRDANGLELYGSDVPVNITITDTYSGIRRVEWSVTAPYDTANNQSGVVDVENNGDLSQDGWITDQENNLVTAMNTTINVSNDSNGIVLSVTMTDRAGNTSTQSIQFSVDKTAPVIDVVYDNNSPDATYTDIYQADRTATITVTERNFNASDIQMAITNTDGVIPTLTGWEEHWNATDPNASYYVARVSYTADGDYTFDIGYTDRAGHAAAAVPQHRFTIDKTIPTLSVSYNNNDVMNGNYYSAQRTATITIVEHNFDPTRVTVLGTATENGAASVFPTLGGWTTQGDTHTATLLYAADGLYTFDIEFNDMAGNAIADFAPQTFYVDQTAPTLEITGVGNQSANNGTVAPVITFFDTNFNPDAVSISLSGVNNGTVNYAGAYEEIANGRRFTYADFEHTKQVDDIYTLTVSLTDRAGNVTTQTITFSANRFGSTYDLTDLADLSGKFVQTEEDVIFEEINVDALNHDTIRIVMTKNGTPVDLVEGTDYTVEVTGGNGQWSVYRYIINRSLFADDGRYTISVYSVDSAGNINENIDEAKQAEISFGVDKTAPVIVPLDLDNGAQYPVQVKDTTVEIRDNLVLENVTIYLNDQAVEYQENEESYQFSIPETNSLQDVRIVAEDAAGNRQEVTVADFLVSTNFFVRWYNNTPLFIGTIAGVVVIALGITAFLVFGRRKKKDEEQEEG